MIVLLILALIVYAYIKRNNVGTGIPSDSYKSQADMKGSYGEMQCESILKQMPYEKLILRNVYIPYGNGHTTEIDLLMIHNSGIYIFECKEYSGWIFGNEMDSEWTQSFANGSKNRFYNPIKQNDTHISCLVEALAGMVSKDDCKSYVVFGNECELKKITGRPVVKVINRRDLFGVCSNDCTKSMFRFSKHEIEDIYSVLIRYCNVSNNVKQEHVDDINKRYGHNK